MPLNDYFEFKIIILMEDLINEFVEITGCSTAIAKHFLEASNGSLEAAIDIYYNQPAPQYQYQNPRPAPQHNSNPTPTPKEDEEPRNYVEDIFQRGNSQQANGPETQGNVEKVKVTFWQNGFVVNDGEFRSNDDPENQEFLRSVSKGMVPKELYKLGSEIDVEIEDNREKNYVQKPKPKNPWSGACHTLSGQQNNSAQPNVHTAKPTGPVRNNYVDPSKPSTKVKLQLPNGQLMLSVNTTATVRDLKSYIYENNPQLKYKELKLSTVFPPREITDDNQTIEQAGLKMSQIKVITL